MENLLKNNTAHFVVEMKDIVKRFPGVAALDHVNFQLRPGEVHVLLGENGAGKSTLIKVLSGAYIADEGEIFIDGKWTREDKGDTPTGTRKEFKKRHRKKSRTYNKNVIKEQTVDTT